MLLQITQRMVLPSKYLAYKTHDQDLVMSISIFSSPSDEPPLTSFALKDTVCSPRSCTQDSGTPEVCLQPLTPSFISSVSVSDVVEFQLTGYRNAPSDTFTLKMSFGLKAKRGTYCVCKPDYSSEAEKKKHALPEMDFHEMCKKIVWLWFTRYIFP